jgi:hypothetical protein
MLASCQLAGLCWGVASFSCLPASDCMIPKLFPILANARSHDKSKFMMLK